MFRINVVFNELIFRTDCIGKLDVISSFNNSPKFCSYLNGNSVYRMMKLLNNFLVIRILTLLLQINNLF